MPYRSLHSISDEVRKAVTFFEQDLLRSRQTGHEALDRSDGVGWGTAGGPHGLSSQSAPRPRLAGTGFDGCHPRRSKYRRSCFGPSSWGRYPPSDASSREPPPASGFDALAPVLPALDRRALFHEAPPSAGDAPIFA